MLSSDVLSLASGYGYFPTPPAAAEAAMRVIQSGRLPLSEAAGMPELREALAHRYQQPGGAHPSPEQVVVTPGAGAALRLLLQAVLAPGDEVLLPTPNWFGFTELVKRAGGRLRTLPLNPTTGYALSPDMLRAALTPRTRLLLLTNPNNPTGRVYHRAELADLLAVTREFPDLFVLSDEIYDLVTFGPAPVPSLLDFADPHGRHLVVNGFSKSLALVGWGVGYLVAPPTVAQACAAALYAGGGPVAAPNQHAALAATRAAGLIAPDLLRQLRPTRQLLLDYFGTLPGVPAVAPEATYYLFPDLRAYCRPELSLPEAGAALVADLLAAGVEVVDGTSCGAPGFVRLSYAVPEPVLRQALNRLSQVLGQ